MHFQFGSAFFIDICYNKCMIFVEKEQNTQKIALKCVVGGGGQCADTFTFRKMGV